MTTTSGTNGTYTSTIGGIHSAWDAEKNSEADHEDVTALTDTQRETLQHLHTAIDHLFGAPSDGARYQIRTTPLGTTIVYVWPNYARMTNAVYGIRAELDEAGTPLEEHLAYITGDEATWYARQERAANIAHACDDEAEIEVVESWFPVRP